MAARIQARENRSIRLIDMLNLTLLNGGRFCSFRPVCNRLTVDCEFTETSNAGEWIARVAF
jgi:hypothetical protein